MTVEFFVENKIGHVVLNSPKTLNALSLSMIKEITEKLKSWKTEPQVHMLAFLKKEGRAFCAGGDVVSLYHAMVAGDFSGTYFEHEYRLDQMIHEYPKKIICFAEGIVMGGGIGIMNGANYRIVTEDSLLAMPEISIGLFPDVGGTYFLNKMPGNCGKFLALTGARLNASDCLFLGLADNFISKELLPMFKKRLGEDQDLDIPSLIKEFEDKSLAQRPKGEVEPRFNVINELVASNEIQEIEKNWKNLKSEDPWLNRSIKNFLKGSPTSIAVIMEQLKRGAGLSLADVFRMELTMAKNFLKMHDFKEGVRALLIEKDNKPVWAPGIIKEVTNELVQKHFEEV